MLDGDLGKIDDEMLVYLNRVYKSTNLLLDLVNDMLDLSKMESGKMPFSYETIDFPLFLENIVFDMNKLASGKNIIITSELAFDALDICSDVQKLSRVIINILGNAVKFTPQNGKIHVHSFIQDANLHIVIQDTGIGITEDQLPYIFEKFSQINNSLTRDTPGTGLGLSISKKIVNNLGGEILVESQP